MNKDYHQFTVENFIADESFQRWVKNPTPENSRFWEQWLRAHPAKLNDVTQAINFLNGMQFKTDFPAEDDIEFAYKKQLQLIDAVVDLKPQSKKKKLVSAIFGWTAGILFTGMVIFAGWFFWRPGTLTIQIVTDNYEIKTVRLPDSSVITLNTNSRLRYSSNLNEAGIREVWLDGEGFLSINDENTDPFLLHSGELDAEVFGTSFNVQKRGAIINVSVNSGKIKIDLNDDPGSVIYLQPGDFIQYSDRDKHIYKKQVISDLYSGWMNERFELNNVPLAELTEYITDVYGYTTKIDNTELAERKISGILLLSNETSFMETLSFVANIDIVKKGSVVILQNKKY